MDPSGGPSPPATRRSIFENPQRRPPGLPGAVGQRPTRKSTWNGDDQVQPPQQPADYLIQVSYLQVFTTFMAMPPSLPRTTGSVDQFLRQKVDDQHFTNLGLKGEYRTFLHYLVQRSSCFHQTVDLFKWVMDTYPELYREGIKESDSFLHFAAKRCKSSDSTEYLSTLVKLYPRQLVDILRDSEDALKLLNDIMPFIRTAAGPEFLVFFGDSPESPKLKPCDCMNCIDTSASLEQNGVGDNEYQHKVSARSSEISRVEEGDVVILRWKSTPRVDPTSPTQMKSTSRVEPASPTHTKSDPVMQSKDDANNEAVTLLHRAATYEDCDDAGYAAQFNLVKHILHWRPEALKLTDSNGSSAYLARTARSTKGRSVTNNNIPGDPIAFFLKDRTMHLEDRDLVLELLYGKSDVAPNLQKKRQPVPPTESSKPERDAGCTTQEREIHLDLRELQIPGLSSVKEGDLLKFIETLDFEDILQYVQIPRHPFRPKGANRPLPDTPETQPDKDGLGRRDFLAIFELLKKKGVRKILRLIVDDDDTCPHQEDVIEELKTFEIEDFQWRRMDIPSMVLRHGVSHVRILHLFSSGNHSVLREWSSSDGLPKLGLLNTVYLRLYWKTESRARMERYATDFIARMVANCPRVRLVEVRLEPLTSKVHDEWLMSNSLVNTNAWLQTMQRFASMVGNAINLRASEAESQATTFVDQTSHHVRVAILDDGIDWSFAKGIRCVGRSFYADKRQDFEGQKVWYSSSTDHGTLMAALVDKICPYVNLYIARLDQTQTAQGVFQPTHQSAIKAIKWAIQMNVHVISMSWTIPGEYRDLENAIKDAQRAGILMFGAASDQGANSVGPPYMAKMSGTPGSPVICIGGSSQSGYGDEKARAEAEFFFPGQTHGIPPPLPHIKTNFGVQIASSVATALATGLSALIMLLVNISPTYGGNAPGSSGLAKENGAGIRTTGPADTVTSYRQQLQNPETIRKLFRHLLSDPEQYDRHNELRSEKSLSNINVGRFFKHKRLARDLKSRVGPDKTFETLDEILERIIRPLIDKDKQNRENQSDSDSGDEDE